MTNAPVSLFNLGLIFLGIAALMGILRLNPNRSDLFRVGIIFGVIGMGVGAILAFAPAYKPYTNTIVLSGIAGMLILKMLSYWFSTGQDARLRTEAIWVVFGIILMGIVSTALLSTLSNVSTSAEYARKTAEETAKGVQEIATIRKVYAEDRTKSDARRASDSLLITGLRAEVVDTKLLLKESVDKSQMLNRGILMNVQRLEYQMRQNTTLQQQEYRKGNAGATPRP